MNKFIFLISLIACLILSISCGDFPKSKDNPNDIKILAEIKKEAWLKDAFISDQNILFVSMDSEGKPQQGYAKYLCTLLYHNNAKTSWVKIIEYGTTNDPNNPNDDTPYGKLVSDCYCPNWIEGFNETRAPN